jgi:hypothetical protein
MTAHIKCSKNSLSVRFCRSKRVAAFILSLFLLSPTLAFGGYQEKAALWAYFDALSKGDIQQLDVLLSSDFEYHFYKNNELNKLNRGNELKSLKRLFKYLPTNSFNLPDSFAQDKDDRNKFRIKLLVIFEDSPKVITDSFFRGAVLDINETLIVTLDKDTHEIYRIIETKEARRKNKLSFGYLKTIHSKELESKSRDENGPVMDGQIIEGYLLSELLDKNNHELLLTNIQKEDPHGGGITESYYWPNKRRIENFN